MAETLIICIIVSMVIYVIGWNDAYNKGVADTEQRWHDAVIRAEAYAPGDKITITGGVGTGVTATATVTVVDGVVTEVGIA